MKIDAPLELWIAERSVRWQVEVCGATLAAGYALRFFSWRRTAFLVSKGGTLAVAGAPIYLQVKGHQYLEQRIQKFQTKVKDAKTFEKLKVLAGGEEWQELDQWVRACGCIQPFPLKDSLLYIQNTRRDVENTGELEKEMKEAIGTWNSGVKLTRHQALMARNFGQAALICAVLLKLG